ncbi:MAG: hypothetical protein FD162_2859 [Rhodobacteraceae bacterium]|uniref:hypothetical protein n=1 Tax=Cypionkella sp. TaxID=2811411 RepID=UPI001325EA03|nr:hypothetical protein [Cypionkella sp.]KAF0171775.1 MAG: hypothetical protein FD162_2859 [Paracoccaceae bacterium]MDO8327744.1 hypothetical protein [Cypionkella sp.]
MTRRILTPAFMAVFLASTALTAPAFATEDAMVKEIEVTIDLPAITNPAAAMRYTNIAGDLKEAIAARLINRLSDKGMKIGVDISEVELSSSFTDAIGTADTRLVGAVNFTDETDNSHFKSFELTVDVNQAKPFFPAELDVTKLSANSNVFYNAMISAFADNVVLKLNE